MVCMKALKLVLRILVTSLLLFWVFRRVDAAQFWLAVTLARWDYLLALWGCSIVFLVLRAAKMRFILRQQNLPISTFMLFKVSAATFLYSLVLPGSLSSGAKWHILKNATGRGTIIFNGMVYSQLSELWIMSVTALLVLVFSNPSRILLPDSPAWWLPVSCIGALGVLLLLTLAVVSQRRNHWLRQGLQALVQRLPARFQATAQQILREAARFQQAGWRFHSSIVFCTLGLNGGSVLVYYLAAQAANLSIPWTVLIWLSSAIFVLGRLPITIANLGLRDVTLVGILAAYGLEEPAVLFMSMLLFTTVLLKAALGAGFLIHWSWGERRASDPPAP